jgi:gas vesicle protein
LITEEKNIVNSTEDSNVVDDTLDLEVAYARLKKIGKDKFQIDHDLNVSVLEKIKSSSHFFHMNLPEEYAEYFISIEDSSLFWIMDSPVVSFLEEGNKSAENDGGKKDSEPSKLVKDYYSKWVTTPRKSEKKYFANSLVKSILKENSKSIISMIYAGVVYSLDETVRNSETAQDYFDKAEFLANPIEGNDSIKNELLYLLKIFSGFEYFHSGKIYESNQKMKEAAVIKSEGITAKFYLGLTEIMLGNIAAGNDFICDIYEYDLKRLSFAAANNNFTLFQYFLKNPVIVNIFPNKEFGKICYFFEDFLQVKELDSNILLTKMREKYEVFRELHLSEYQEQNVINNFNFIEKMLKNLFTCPLNLFLASAPVLWAKFNETLQLVLSTIRQRFLAEIQVQLKKYDQNINDLNALIINAMGEIEAFKVRYKEKVKNSIVLYEGHFNTQLAALERKLAGTMEDRNNNPANAFKSSITYTVVLASLVLLIAGFAGYSTNYSEELTGFSQIFKAIIVTGGKWGILTFILGFVISVLSSVYAAYERSADKQRITKEISYLKYSREKNIEQIKADAEKSEKIALRNMNEKIEQHKVRIKEISEEKQKHEAELNKQIEAKIKEEAEKLLELIGK